MAFLTPEELKTVAYSYKIEEITETDEEIVLAAIATGEEEVRGYLSANNRKEFADGRPLYDVAAIFNATGTDRNALILQYTKIVALWHLLILCNVDMIYEPIKERYELAVGFLFNQNKQRGCNHGRLAHHPRCRQHADALAVRKPHKI
jgi:hypothetical protein